MISPHNHYPNYHSMKMTPFAFLTAVALATSASTAVAATVLSENFTYGDGSLVGATGSPWATTSGTAGQVNVTSNVLNITFAESEDVNASLSGSPYTSGELTANFDVNFSALPTSNYFAHFLNSNTSFRTKVFSTTSGAAVGTFRLGITNNTNTLSVIVPTDLSLNTPYSITMSFDLDALTSSLAVNGGTVVTASDTISSIAINGFGFRQASGIGTMTIDNLVVTHVPEPSAALLGGLSLLGLLRRRR